MNRAIVYSVIDGIQDQRFEGEIYGGCDDHVLEKSSAPTIDGLLDLLLCNNIEMITTLHAPEYRVKESEFRFPLNHGMFNDFINRYVAQRNQ